MKTFLKDIRETIKANPTAKTENLIYLLNPKIRGWANYHRLSCAKKTFGYVDNCIWQALWRWVHRRHPRKSGSWQKIKFFRCHGLRNWIFSAKIINGNGTKSYVDLFEASIVAVKRHIKIKAEATPYDPCFIEYFEKRKRYLKATRTGAKQPAMIK